MRFRTTLVDVNTLTKVVQTIHKVTARCIVRLDPEDMKLICTADPDGVHIWCQLSLESFFKDYRVESNFNNQINFEVSTDTLLQALRSAVNAVDVLLRLTKRDKEPLLSFSIANATHTGARMEIVQEVGIKVMRPAEAARVSEPMCPAPDVHIYLPKLYKLRAVAERMKAVSSSICISANKDQVFLMAVDQPEISIETTWKKCGRPPPLGESVTYHPAGLPYLYP